MANQIDPRCPRNPSCSYPGRTEVYIPERNSIGRKCHFAHRICDAGWTEWDCHPVPLSVPRIAPMRILGAPCWSLKRKNCRHLMQRLAWNRSCFSVRIFQDESYSVWGWNDVPGPGLKNRQNSSGWKISMIFCVWGCWWCCCDHHCCRHPRWSHSTSQTVHRDKTVTLVLRFAFLQC